MLLLVARLRYNYSINPETHTPGETTEEVGSPIVASVHLSDGGRLIQTCFERQGSWTEPVGYQRTSPCPRPIDCDAWSRLLIRTTALQALPMPFSMMCIRSRSISEGATDGLDSVAQVACMLLDVHRLHPVEHDEDQNM